MDTDYYTEGKYTGRLPNCPIVEVPTPHGQLIDADMFIKIYEPILTFPENEQIVKVTDIIRDLQTAPTIIESESTK